MTGWLIDWVAELEGKICGLVRPHLRTIQELDFPMLDDWNGEDDDRTLFVNAATVPSRSNFEVLKQIATKNRFGVVKNDERIAAALIPASINGNHAERNGILASGYFKSQQIMELNSLGSELDLFEYPHDIVRFNLETFNDNLSYILDQRSLQEVHDGVFVGEGTQLSDHLVFDVSDGPIIIDDHSNF